MFYLFTHLLDSYSLRGAPAERPGWVLRRLDPHLGASTAMWVLTAAWHPAVDAASSPADPLQPRAAGPGRRKCDVENYEPLSGRCWSSSSVASRPAVAPLPTSTGRRHPAAPDDNHQKHRCRSPPGGSRRPPAAVRTASTAPV